MSSSRKSLTIKQVLAWADRHQRLYGNWPRVTSGDVVGAQGETWGGINEALRQGARRLPHGWTLAQLLTDFHRTTDRKHQPRLTVRKILGWVDAHRRRTGTLPSAASGPLVDAPGESWNRINSALVHGSRGLTVRTTLARLLAKYRGKRHPRHLPPLTIPQILKWADEYHRRHGRWPKRSSGAVRVNARETWASVHNALVSDSRGLRKGVSLYRLMAKHRGARDPREAPPLTVRLILAWASAHHRRTGSWPTVRSGAVPETPGGTWQAIGGALYYGRRGLPGGSSLPKLLARFRRSSGSPAKPPTTAKRSRGRSFRRKTSRLTVGRILEWADAHRKRAGRWPTKDSGSIPGSDGENWVKVEHALSIGLRGLKGGSSIARLLAAERGKRNIRDLATLNVKTILRWADAYRRRTGEWPTTNSGPIPESPGDTWRHLEWSLVAGCRGLRRTSLAKLLAKHRGMRNRADLPPLTIDQILVWADAHFSRKGTWPAKSSGEVPGSGGETWKRINIALQQGQRGLGDVSSLPRLLQQHRAVRNHMNLPPLTVKQILQWVDEHYNRWKAWPAVQSGRIEGTSGERWSGVNRALSKGTRGLKGGTSLAKLLDQHRR